MSFLITQHRLTAVARIRTEYKFCGQIELSLSFAVLDLGTLDERSDPEAHFRSSPPQWMALIVKIPTRDLIRVGISNPQEYIHNRRI